MLFFAHVLPLTTEPPREDPAKAVVPRTVPVEESVLRDEVTNRLCLRLLHRITGIQRAIAQSKIASDDIRHELSERHVNRPFPSYIRPRWVEGLSTLGWDELHEQG
jgi:hypothetical protein